MSLPWIRSMPLSSVSDLVVSIDGSPRTVAVALAGRTVPPDRLADETGWWFIQDRLALVGTDPVEPGPREVAVSFVLMVPYLHSGPGVPLSLPVEVTHTLEPGALAEPTVPPVVRDVL
ncbi:hypothetical protein [Subtercola sp. YIM 133946]|uniref:hypothetical protein n=1 Tax=Subtercola sp. YIM 133946 TaxID=3118909 RepID=UPI002F9413A7